MCALVLAVGGGVLGAGVGSAKAADTIIQLPGTYFTQTVADAQDGNSYLFIAADGEIIVADPAGEQIATLDSGDGIGALALSPDGSTLYASVTSGSEAGSLAAITVSSVASGTPAQSFYPLAAGDTPGSLAVQSDKLWVGYSTTTDDVTTWQIGAIDLADGDKFEATAAPDSWTSEPLLAADPDNTGVLVAVDHESPAEAASYQTTTDPATPLAAQAELGSGADSCNYLAQVAVIPGGKEFAAACMGAGVYAYSTANFGEAAFYNANGAGASLTVGVAVDADGSVAVSNRTDIYVYKAGGTLLSTLVLAGDTDDEITESNGLVWLAAPGGPALAAAYNVSDKPPYSLEIFDQAEGLPTLTFTAAAKTSFGHPVTLRGTAMLPSGAAGAAKVTITRSGPGGTVTLPAVTPSSDGVFTTTDTPKAVGTYTYKATIGTASASATATVIQDVPKLTLTSGNSAVNYKTVVHVTATLGPTYVNRSVTIYAEINGSGKDKAIESGKVNAKGQLAVAYTALESTTFRAVYAGDADDTAVQASTVLSVRAQVQEALSGFYGTKKSGGTTYLLYHRTGKVTVAAVVAPSHPGGCVELETQDFYKGAWHASAKTGCSALNRASKATLYLTVSKAELGSPYRIRVDYVSTSPQSASSDSAWGYIMVEK